MKAKSSVILFGIRRSGNHLLRSWISLMHPKPSSFFSNVQLEFFHRVEEAKIEDIDEYNFVVINIEEHPPETIKIAHSDSIGEIKRVIVLRDPYNLFASRVKHYNMMCYRTFNADFIRYLWTDYARYYLRKPLGVKFILFNRFVSDIDYRRSLCEWLGQEFDEVTDKFVMDRVDKRNSKGSSFDAYESNASQMKVNERWKIYKDTEVYRMLFNREIRELSSEIFAFAPI